MTLADLSERVPDERLPWLDRRDVDESALTERQRAWRRDGFLELPGFMSDELIDAYCAVHQPQNVWQSVTPYLFVPELRDCCLYPPLLEVMRDLLRGEPGLHLNLTDWLASERDWHQDAYLNPRGIDGHYAAVWIACGDIHPDSGPLEVVPGSHRLPVMLGDRVRALMKPEEAADPIWPRTSEYLTTPIFEAEIARLGLGTKLHLPKKGDVLIWHFNLVHRGTRPKVRGRERRSLIAHYTSLTHRPDMPWVAQHEGGGWYFVFAGTPHVTRMGAEVVPREAALG